MVNKMVIFKLLEETENTAIYEYFPENDKHRKYACKVIRRLIEFQKNTKYEKSGLVAWY